MCIRDSGLNLSVEPLKKLRPQIQFDNIKQLSDQIKRDRDKQPQFGDKLCEEDVRLIYNAVDFYHKNRLLINLISRRGPLSYNQLLSQ